MSRNSPQEKPRPFRPEFWRYSGEKITWGERELQLPLEVEIGGGVGWFAIQHAKADSQMRLISLERTREKSDKGRRRLENHPELTNLRILNADARAYFSSELELNSVSRVWILYPNPNPKNASERFFVSSFFERIQAVLAPGGEIVLVTNIREYFEEACTAVERRNDGLRLERKIELQGLNQHSPRTHFEKKYLERGEICYEGRFRKSGEGRR